MLMMLNLHFYINDVYVLQWCYVSNKTKVYFKIKCKNENSRKKNTIFVNLPTDASPGMLETTVVALSGGTVCVSIFEPVSRTCNAVGFFPSLTRI